MNHIKSLARLVLLLATIAASAMGCGSSTACGAAGQACCTTGSQCNSSTLSCEANVCTTAGMMTCDFDNPASACMECLVAGAPDGCGSQLRVCENNAMCGASMGPLESCLCAASDAAAAADCIGTFETAAGSALGGMELGTCATDRCASACGR